MKKYCYRFWTDNLNVLSLMILAVLGLIYPCKEVRYLRISRRLKGSMARFRAFMPFELTPAHGDGAKITSAQERAIYHESYRQKSALAIEFSQDISSYASRIHKVSSVYNEAKVGLFFRQEIASDIEQFLVLNNFMKCYSESCEGLNKARDIAVVCDNVWIPKLSGCTKGLVYRIYAYPNMRKAIESFFIPSKIFIELVFNALLIACGRAMKPGPGKLPNIGVLHAQGTDVGKKSDFFWFPNSGIDPQRIIVYFKYHCWPPEHKACQAIESYGMRWVDLLPWKLPGIKVFSASPEFYRLPHSFYVKKLATLLLLTARLWVTCLAGRTSLRFWAWRNLINLLDRTVILESFLNIYNIKVHYGIYEAGADVAAASIATELAEGTDLYCHWSNFDIMEISTGKSHDINFSWGPYYLAHFFPKEFYNFGHFIFMGYPYDSLFPGYKLKGRLFRQEIMKNGALFIVTFFDQTYPSSWPKANSELEKVYTAFLDKVVQDPTFGLITKPKKLKEFWKKMPNLSALAKKAQETGRCIYLDGSVYANQAAQAADLAVGFGVYSTPALEAALSGIPAIACDLQNFSDHPFYAKGFNTFVFNDLTKMMEAIESIKDKKTAAAGVADYSSILTDIDPFRDGRACERMGSFIRSLLCGFDAGIDKHEAIRKAVYEYRREWGDDKVLNFMN